MNKADNVAAPNVLVVGLFTTYCRSVGLSVGLSQNRVHVSVLGHSMSLVRSLFTMDDSRDCKCKKKMLVLHP